MRKIVMPERKWIPTPKEEKKPKTIEMPERRWVPTPDRYQDVRLCDGLNQGLNPLDIGPGQSTSILNFVPYEYPTLTVRKGYTQVGNTHSGHYITHLRKFSDTLVQGTKYGVYKLNGSGGWDNIINNGSAAERYWECLEYDGTLYMADGLSKVQKYKTSLSTVSDTPANTRHITLHANRMFLIADDEPNVLRWSKYENPDVFTTFLGDNSDPGFQPINTNVADPITGIVTYRNRVVIFKKHSFHELFGERGYDFAIQDVSTHVGCVAWRTICEVNGILYFLSANGVCAYSGGNTPRKPISDPVKHYFNSINWSQINQCVSGTDGRRLFLTLVTGSSTEPNVTIMYDPEKGPDNGWFVMDYNATAFLDDEDNWYTGTTSGIVYKMDDGDTNSGNAINYEVIAKPIVLGNWHKKHETNRIRVLADIPAGATMNVYYSKSTHGDDWTLIKQIEQATDVTNTRIDLIGERSEWFRIKINGTGRPKIYSIAYEVD